MGGANTAVEETLHLAKYVDKVTLIHRRDQFRTSLILVEEFLAKEPDSNLVIRYDTIPLTINGDGKVQSVTFQNVKTKAQEDYPCDGVFIFVDTVPNTDFLKGFVELTDTGFIKCDCAYLRTSVPGVFMAGDCRVGAAMQLVTAVADGVNAAMRLKEYFRDPAWWDEKPKDML